MNEGLIAVAGSGKTYSVVERYLKLRRRTLFVTYTTNNQEELRHRLNSQDHSTSHEVQGWYQFLIANFLKPYMRYFSEEIEFYQGFNFEYKAAKYSKGIERYFDNEGRVGRETVGYVARMINEKSKGKPIVRLSEIYDEIVIDEVQDLAGSDLEIIESLFKSEINVYFVGDFRQSVYSTNTQDGKNKNYRGFRALEWYKERERRGQVALTFSTINRRCDDRIVRLSNMIFMPEVGFEDALGEKKKECHYPGVHVVTPRNLPVYMAKFSPLCLRWDKRSAREHAQRYEFKNFGEVKGLTVDRVLIVPTDAIKTFLNTGKPVEKDLSAAKLYVAITRARLSIAFLLPDDFKLAEPIARLVDESINLNL